MDLVCRLSTPFSSAQSRHHYTSHCITVSELLPLNGHCFIERVRAAYDLLQIWCSINKSVFFIIEEFSKWTQSPLILTT